MPAVPSPLAQAATVPDGGAGGGRRAARSGSVAGGRIAALAAVAMLALAGCGGAPGESGSPSRTSAPPAGTAGASPSTGAPGPSASGGAGPVTAAPSLVAAIGSLAVAPEERAGYVRELFVHWTDADGDGCDTRDEVLARESLVPVAGCGRTGQWVSLYDGESTDDGSRFDVDHVVPLAEAWDSGARTWDAARRQAFANDLDGAQLRAVTASSNRTKSDQDPATWLPPLAAVRCQYVTDWVSVKVTWALSVDPAERDALLAVAATCPEPLVPGRRAADVLAAAGITPVPMPALSPAAAAVPPTGADGTGAVYYPNCSAVRAAGAAPLAAGAPGYRAGLDGDGDGTACE